MDLSLFINKHKYKLAFGLFILYLCFSLYKIGENSLWGDECFSIDLGSHTIKEIIDYSWYKDTNPPLYLIIVHYWVDFFGNSEFALRSLSAISTSMACGIFFLLALRFFNWQTAVFSALFFFSSNELYYYSEEGRTYGLILLFCTLSNYTFLNIIRKPNWVKAILLGLFNISIFYLHTLASINFVGQVLLALVLAYNSQRIKKGTATKYFLGYDLKFITWYIVSWLVFLLLFLPWQERFFGIIKDGAKGFWLQKPTIMEYKQILYDFYNSDYLFYTHAALITILLLILLFLKKYREVTFNYKLLLIPIIFGPFLFHVNFFAAAITPIFLKRYVLFTLLGFILMFAYIISSIKINFKFKFLAVVLLCILSFSKIKYPRECYWDYKNGVSMLMKKKSSNTYIFTDIAMLFAYYADNEGAFKAYENERYAILAKQNIFTAGGTDWPKFFNFSKYKDIYYTRSFEQYNDPGKIIETTLREKFTWVEDLNMPGIKISHYKNYIIDKKILDSLKQKIVNDTKWYNQIILKAKQRNVSIDSMITLDAIWDYKTRK